MALCGCTSQSSETDHVDASEIKTPDADPKLVLKEFYGSIIAQDLDQAIACTTGGDLTERFVGAQLRVEEAFSRLNKNGVAEFGDQGQIFLQPTPVSLVLSKVDELPVSIAGSTASWPVDPNNPLKLVPVDGQWRIDLVGSIPDPEALEATVVMFNDLATKISHIADEIAEKKYETVESVQAAIKTSLNR